jgi:hypothetical protein
VGGKRMEKKKTLCTKVEENTMNFLSFSLSFQNAPNTAFNIESHQRNQNPSLNNLFNYKYNIKSKLPIPLTQ